MKTSDPIADLALFAQVAAKGSMTGAAKAVGLTPAAVSKRIGQLEMRLGARLMQRTTRKLALTAEGADFHGRVLAILADIAEAEAAARGSFQEPSGLLRVTAPAAFARRFIASAVPDFLARHPRVSIELDMTDLTVDMLEGRYDLAVRVADLADSSFIARRLGTNRRMLVASPGYLKTNGEPKTLIDLAKHNCLIATTLAAPRLWSFDGPKGRERVKVSGSFASNNSDAIHQAVVAGLGIAYRSFWDVAEDLEAGRLKAVLTAYKPPTVGIWAIYPPTRSVPGKVRAFIDFLAERFKTQPVLSD